MAKHRLLRNNYLKKFILRYLFPGVLLCISGFLLIEATGDEYVRLNQMKYEIEQAEKEQEVLAKNIAEKQEELESAERAFVTNSGLKTNVILCFSDFEEGVYGDLITYMDEFGYPGVIIFRSDNMPGMPGSISIEKYKELVEKGWEGAIATEMDKTVYNGMADILVRSWREYMFQMKSYFEKNGLEFPRIYVLDQGEDISSVKQYFSEYGIDTYTWLEDSVEDATEDMEFGTVWKLGMLRSRYSYTDLENDLKYLNYYGKSMAMRFLTVESAAPRNKRHTSLYRIYTYLKQLYENGNVNVVTFSEYRSYMENFEKENKDLISEYQIAVENINKAIEEMKNESRENFRKAISNDG